MGRDRDWLLKSAALAAAAVLCAALARIWSGYAGAPKYNTSLTLALLVVTATGLVRFLAHVWKLWRMGCPNPIEQLRKGLPAAILGFAPIVLGVLIIGIFLVSLGYLKSMLTALVPFWADEPLAAMDHAAGIDPEGIARALQPWIFEIGIFYGCWHLMHLGSILWVLHWNLGEKSRFIVGFMLTWAIGMLLAFAFSSAGPIFTGRFDPALAPESVREMTAYLWANYESGGAVIGGGISAFPSLHVAIAAWFALVLRERGLAWIGVPYVGAIFAGSVILGWHYTADGIAGIVIALLADRLSRAWLGTSPSGTETPPIVAAAS